MKKNFNTTLLYSLLALTSLLVAMLGYVYTHKPFVAENLVGLLTALWQTLVAFTIIALAGGIGEAAFRLQKHPPLVRIGLDLALGIPILSIATLSLGTIIGVSFAFLGSSLD
jgi:predicted anti-sigma-YlaC factor YlaD